MRKRSENRPQIEAGQLGVQERRGSNRTRKVLNLVAVRVYKKGGSVIRDEDIAGVYIPKNYVSGMQGANGSQNRDNQGRQMNAVPAREMLVQERLNEDRCLKFPPLLFIHEIADELARFVHCDGFSASIIPHGEPELGNLIRLSLALTPSVSLVRS